MRSPKALLHEQFEVARFLDEVRQMPEVLEYDPVTGDPDRVLKVLVCNHRDFVRYGGEKLIRIPAVAAPNRNSSRTTSRRKAPRPSIDLEVRCWLSPTRPPMSRSTRPIL